jgi:hypothetical protein
LSAILAPVNKTKGINITMMNAATCIIFLNTSIIDKVI